MIVVKCAGANEDGVKVGDELCYRCRYGQSPMVMVFTRNADESVASLSQRLNELVEKNTESKLKAFVNIMGENREQLEAQAKKFGEANKLTQVPVVVPTEFENGPANYGITSKADVTVLICNKSSVVANYAFGKGELNKETLQKVLADVAKIVK